MKRKLWVATIALSCSCLTAPLIDPCVARAGTSPRDGTVNETRPAKANGVVEIDVASGSIKVVAWNKAEVNVTGRVEQAELEVTTSADRTQVRVSNERNGGGGHIEVRVPRGSRIEAKGVSAGVDVRDVTGALRLHSASGNITVSAPSSDVEAQTVSGEVELAVQSAVVNARSVSGDVRVFGARGRAAINSVSGDCVLEGGDFTEVEMRAVSGDLRFTGGISGQGTFELKSHSGDIELRLPAATNADFELRSFSGSLQTNRGAGSSQKARSALDFRAGSGGAKVHGKTFSGDVRVEFKVEAKK